MSSPAPSLTRGAQPRHVALLTLCVMLATIMQALDTTIANVALPYMQGSLSATTDQINWVLTSYIVASAIMTPVTPPTIDISCIISTRALRSASERGIWKTRWARPPSAVT